MGIHTTDKYFAFYWLFNNNDPNMKAYRNHEGVKKGMIAELFLIFVIYMVIIFIKTINKPSGIKIINYYLIIKIKDSQSSHRADGFISKFFFY